MTIVGAVLWLGWNTAEGGLVGDQEGRRMGQGDIQGGPNRAVMDMAGRRGEGGAALMKGRSL